MKKLYGPLLFGGLLLSGTLALAVDTGTDVCDMKTIEDGLYCAECDEVLDADSVTKNEYCSDCYETAMEAKEKPEKAQKVKVCVKTYFACPECFEESKAAGECPECKVKLEKAVDKALIVFACQECGKEYEKAGLCDEEDCMEMKAKVVQTCSKSGTFPHVK
ncbi:MAG: hypothetical protein V2A76_15945 [Planctomycetota bacterium]